MPIVSAYDKNPLDDGRQSARALSVRRGVQSLFADLNAAHLPELTLANGRRADLVAIMPDGDVVIVEIKSSVEDMRADNKWPDYREFCDRLFFATLDDVPLSLFPEDCGFIIADAHGAHMVREAPRHALAAARRKAMTTRFARQAANRLYLAELAQEERR